MNDEELNAYYADPEHRVITGAPKRRAKRPLSTHVPIRFRPDVIANVKTLARLDRKTVSSWIRDVVESEVERRMPDSPRTSGSVMKIELEGALLPQFPTVSGPLGGAGQAEFERIH